MKQILAAISLAMLLTGCPPPNPATPVAAPVTETPPPPKPAMTVSEKIIRLSDIAAYGTNGITVFLVKEDSVLFVQKNTVIPSNVTIVEGASSISLVGSGIDVAKVYKQLYNVGPEGRE